MLRAIAYRLLSLLLTLFVISVVIFIILEVLPGDPAAIMLGTSLQADTRRAREVLGFTAEIPFEDGLGRYIDWFRAHRNDPSVLLEAELCNWQMPVA